MIGKTNCPPVHRRRQRELDARRDAKPIRLQRSPGGSSSGEAAIIAAGGSPIGMGSDSGGSIRLPAHYCGMAALKPTAGRVPSTGGYGLVGGMSDPRSQVGPMARYVDDLWLLLPSSAGPDGVDSGVVPMPIAKRTWASSRAAGRLVLGRRHHQADPRDHRRGESGGECPARRPDARSRQAAAAGPGRGAGGDAGLLGPQAHRHARGCSCRWDGFRSGLLGFMAEYDIMLSPVAAGLAPEYGASRGSRTSSATRSPTAWEATRAPSSGRALRLRACPSGCSSWPQLARRHCTQRSRRPSRRRLAAGGLLA